MSGHVFVVGSINVDLIVSLPQLPRPGETVLGGRISRAPGGKGANKAVAAARLGAPTTLVAAIGDDDDGKMSLTSLRGEGIDVSAVATVDEPTGVGVVLVADDGENAIAVASGANASLSGEMVRDALGTRLGSGDVVIANLEIGDEAVEAAATAAEAAGAVFVLNPAPARPLGRELVGRCDVLTPNRVEMRELGYDGPADLLETGLRALVVTLGADGADVYRSGQPVMHQAPFAAAVVDTTGAGDAFSAGLACALAEGASLEAAVRWAAGTGAMATRALGARAAYPSRRELEAMLGTATEGRQTTQTQEEAARHA